MGNTAQRANRNIVVFFLNSTQRECIQFTDSTMQKPKHFKINTHNELYTGASMRGKITKKRLYESIINC